MKNRISTLLGLALLALLPACSEGPMDPTPFDVQPAFSSHGNQYFYVDWTAANAGAGTASGVITLDNGSTVSVNLRVTDPNGPAPLFGYRVQGSNEAGISGFNESQFNNWFTYNNPSPYVSAEVPNGPGHDNDIIGLAGGQVSGHPLSSYVITFDPAVSDPIMAIMSLGATGNPATYDFDRPFEILSQGPGRFGGGSASLWHEPGEKLTGREGNGTIRFTGSFSSFAWTVPDGEVWHGLTIGVRGASDPNVDSDGDGVPDATDNCPLVSNAGQADADFDGIGTACDSDPNDGNQDTDGDGLTNTQEHTLGTSPTNPDTDGDGFGDGSDNCPALANPSQSDLDGNGQGDACQTVFTGGTHVDTWDPIIPTNMPGDWTSSICTTVPAIGPNDSRWTGKHKAFAFGTAAHPWQIANNGYPGPWFTAPWINSWDNLASSGTPAGVGGRSPWFNWTKYETQVEGAGDFVLQLLADNCSWIYLDGRLVGFQPTEAVGTGDLAYPVDLSGTHTLTFVIFDGGGAAGGQYRIETASSFQQSNVYGVILQPAVVVPDTDGDGVPDDLDTDDDGDGILDPDELDLGTDPLNEDTDGDGYNDGVDAFPLDPTRHSFDETPPAVTYALWGDLGNNDWYTGPVTITWTVVDNESEAALTGCETVTESDDGTGYTFTCSATSEGGTTSVTSEAFKIDQTAPSLSGALSGALGNNGWYTGPVTGIWTASDGGSGLVANCADETETADGMDYSFSCTVEDNAGNEASETTETFMIDGTDPTVTYSGNVGPYDIAAMIDITCVADDNLSGIAAGTDTCADVAGMGWEFGSGASFSAEAEDNAGNTFSSSTSFDVTVSFEGTCALVELWVEHRGVANSLCVKIAAAQRSDARGKTKARDGSLNAFINEVQAQAGKKVPTEKVAFLIGFAQALMD